MTRAETQKHAAPRENNFPLKFSLEPSIDQHENGDKDGSVKYERWMRATGTTKSKLAGRKFTLTATKRTGGWRSKTRHGVGQGRADGLAGWPGLVNGLRQTRNLLISPN